MEVYGREFCINIPVGDLLYCKWIYVRANDSLFPENAPK